MTGKGEIEDKKLFEQINKLFGCPEDKKKLIFYLERSQSTIFSSFKKILIKNGIKLADDQFACVKKEYEVSPDWVIKKIKKDLGYKL